jgi:hypothetical protein
MTDNDKSGGTTPAHLTTAQRDAQNPEGQRHTMAGTTGQTQVPNSDMHSTVQKSIDPTGFMGCTKNTP